MPGTRGVRGSNGAIGTHGTAGIAGGDCQGKSFLSITSNAESVAAGASFTVTVDVGGDGLFGQLGQQSFVKLNIDPLLGPQGTIVFHNGVTLVGSAGSVHVVLVPSNVHQFHFELRTSAAHQGYADISGFLSLADGQDCAYANKVVQIGTQFVSGQCGCPMSGDVICSAHDGCQCSCAGERRRNIGELVKRSTDIVAGTRVAVQLSVTYRRQSRGDSSDSSSSSNSVSRCGPHASLFVDKKRVWSNSAQVEFGSEGVVSGEISFEVPYDVSQLYELEIKTKGCAGYSVSVWDPHYTVRVVAGTISVPENAPLSTL